MQALFRKRKNPSEILKENKRCLNKAIRELDKEKTRLEGEEKKIIIEIKKMAKMNQMDSVRIMTKQLVRTRNYCKKFSIMKANVQTVFLKIATLKSQDSMAAAMKGVAIAMRKMNNRMNLPEIQKIMMDFEKQSAIIDIKEEILDDAVDDTMGDTDEPDETDGVVNQILDELGIQIGNELRNLPEGPKNIGTNSQKNEANTEGVVGDTDADLVARLENLRH